MNTIEHEHEKQLHHRIVERCAQMNRTLAALRIVPRTATSVRARAIAESLAALQTYRSGSWDTINQAESAVLTYWLDRSRYLYDVPRPVSTPGATP